MRHVVMSIVRIFFRQSRGLSLILGFSASGCKAISSLDFVVIRSTDIGRWILFWIELSEKRGVVAIRAELLGLKERYRARILNEMANLVAKDSYGPSVSIDVIVCSLVRYVDLTLCLEVHKLQCLLTPRGQYFVA